MADIVPRPKPEQPTSAESVLNYSADTVSATAKGVVEGVIVQPLEAVDELLPLGRVVFDDNWVPRYISPSEEEELGLDEVPTWLESVTTLDRSEENNIAAVLGHGVGQVVGGLLGPAKIIPGGGSTKVGKIASGLAKGTAVDALSFDPDEGKLGDLAVELGVPVEFVNEIFLTNPNDSDTWNRIEQAVEGGVIGVATAAILRLILRGRGAKGPVGDAAEETIDEVIETAPPVAARIPQRPVEISGPEQKAAQIFVDDIKKGVDPLADRNPSIFKETVPARISSDKNVTRVVARVREHFVQVVSKGYDQSTMGRFTNALTQNTKDRMTIAAARTMQSLEAGDIAGVMRGVDNMGKFVGSDATMKSTIRRIALREVAEMSYANAKKVLKEAKDTGYRKSTDELFERTATDQVDLWLAITKEARAEGRAFSAATRNVGEGVSPVFDDENFVSGFLDDLDDVARDLVSKFNTADDGAVEATQKVAKDAVKKARPKKDPGADALEQGYEKALDLKYDKLEAFEMAEQFAKEIMNNPKIPRDPGTQNQMVASMYETIVRFMKEVYITNILSSVKTITVNVVSTLGHTIVRPTAKALGSLATADLKQAQLAMREFNGYLYGAKEASKIALRAGKLRAGQLEDFDTRQLSSSTFDPREGQFVRNLMKRVYTFAVDTQLATDEFHKQLRYRGIRYARAQQRASELKLNSQETKTFVEDYVQKGFDADGRATDNVDLAEAKATAFQTPWDDRAGPVGKAIAGLEKMRHKDDIGGLLTTVVFPFVRTPTNLIAEAATYVVPTGFVPQKMKFWKAGKGEMGPEARAIARGKFMIGMANMSLAYSAYESGYIGFTGPAESYWSKARQERETLPPFSIVIGGKAYPLANFAPFSAPLLGVAAHVQGNFWAEEASRSLPGEHIDRSLYEQISPIALASIAVLSEAPMFTGLQRLVDVGTQFGAATETGDYSRVSRSLAYMTAGFTTPGHVKWTTRAFEDDIQKEANTILDVYLKELPWSGFGTPKRDVMGNILKHDWNLFRGVEVQQSPGYQLLYSLLKNPATNKDFELKGPKSVFRSDSPLAALTEGSVDLSQIPVGDQSAWDEYQDLVFKGKPSKDKVKKFRDQPNVLLYKKGETLRESVERLAADKSFASLSPILQVKAINELFSVRRKAAKETLKEHPDFKAYYEPRKSLQKQRKKTLKQHPFVEESSATGLRGLFPSLNPLEQAEEDFKGR